MPWTRNPICTEHGFTYGGVSACAIDRLRRIVQGATTLCVIVLLCLVPASPYVVKLFSYRVYRVKLDTVYPILLSCTHSN